MRGLLIPPVSLAITGGFFLPNLAIPGVQALAMIPTPGLGAALPTRFGRHVAC